MSTTTTTTAGAPVAQTIEAAGAGSVRLPDGFPIADADFGRVGPNLVLTAPDGEQVVVRGFFEAATPPKLTLPDGAEFSGSLAAKLAGPQAPAQVAQAGPDVATSEPIGTVENLVGTVTVTRADGTRTELETGDPVFQGDILESGEDGAIGIVFADETSFSMAENGRMVLDEMIYDPGAGDGSLSVSVVKGVFTFVSGQIAKTDPEAMSIETPVATIGIRGTQGGLDTGSDGQTLKLLMMTELVEQPDGTVVEVVGELKVEIGGQVFTINQADFGLIADSGGVQTRQFTPQEIIDGFAKALGVMPSGGRPMNRYGVEERGSGDDLADFEPAAGEGDAPGADAPPPPPTFAADVQVTDAGLDLGELIVPVTPVDAPPEGGPSGGDGEDSNPDDDLPPPPPPADDGAAFLQGTFIEYAVTSDGDTFDTNAGFEAPPAGFHPTEIGGLGLVFDVDGFDQGAAPTTKDVTLPGQPVDLTSVGYRTTMGGDANSIADFDADFVGATTNTSADDLLSATTSINAGGVLRIDQNTHFNVDDTFVTIDVTMTNISGGGLYDVRYLRSFDPDHDSAGPLTINDVFSDSFGEIVTAQAPTAGEDIEILTMDPNARASGLASFEGSSDPFQGDVFDTPRDPDGANEDGSINMAFAFGSLSAGASVTFTYYISIDTLGAGNDLFSGTGSGEVIDGQGGNDILLGLGGADTLIGGDGNDRVYGGDGNDLLVGGSGAGDDSYDGGVGIDTVSFASTTAGVTVDLGAGTAFGSETGSDTLTGIEGVVGGSGNDTLNGDGEANVLSGGGGNDILNGGSGDDVFSGGGGDDILAAGAGSDTLTGGAGADTFSFAMGDGNNTVTDFGDADVIRILGFGAGEVSVTEGAVANISAGTGGNAVSIDLQGQGGNAFTVTAIAGGVEIAIDAANRMGALNVTGTFDVPPDGLAVDGDAIVASTGTLDVGGAAMYVDGDMLVEGTTDNAGTVLIAGNDGGLGDDNGLTVDGGTFTNDGVLHVKEDDPLIEGGGSLVNDGFLGVFDAPTQVRDTGELVNNGIANLVDDVFDLFDNGTFTNAADALTVLQDNNLETEDLSAITNDGHIYAAYYADVFTFDTSTFDNAGMLTLNSGSELEVWNTSTFTNTGTVHAIDDDVFVRGGTLVNSDELVVHDEGLEVRQGGSLTNEAGATMLVEDLFLTDAGSNLTNNGELIVTFDQPRLNQNTMLTNNGDMTVVSGRMEVYGTVVNNGDLTLAGAGSGAADLRIFTEGTVTNNVGATITVADEIVGTAGILNNFGTINTGDFQFTGTINGGGAINLTGSLDVFGDLSTSGTIRADEDASVTDLNNSGTVYVSNALDIGNDLTNAAAGEVVVDSNLFVEKALSNDGTLFVGGAIGNNTRTVETLVNTGFISVDNDIWVTDSIDNSGMLLSDNDIQVDDGGLINFAGGFIGAEDVETDFGDIDNRGTLIAGDDVEVDDGNLINAAGGFVSAGEDVHVEQDLTNDGIIASGEEVVVDGLLTNRGTLSVGDLITANGNLVNESGGVVTVGEDFLDDSFSAQGDLTNHGEFVASGDGAVVNKLTNTGTFIVGGLVTTDDFDNSGTFLGTIDLDVADDFTNAGLVDIRDDLGLGNGTNAVVIGSGDKGVARIGGEIDFDGTLDISFDAGFAATVAVGDTFDIFSFTDSEGEFDDIVGLDALAGSGIILDPIFNDTELRLVARAANSTNGASDYLLGTAGDDVLGNGPAGPSEQKIQPNDGVNIAGSFQNLADSQFSSRPGILDISGDRFIYSAMLDDVGSDIDAGQAFIYQFNGTEWVQEAALTAPPLGITNIHNQFGTSVAIDGNWAVVGEEQHGELTAVTGSTFPWHETEREGAAHVYNYDGSSWSFVTTLRDSFPQFEDIFGSGIDIDADGAPGGLPRVVVGSAGDNPGNWAGQAHVFDFDGTSWNQSVLANPQLSTNDYFGGYVRVDGDTVMVSTYANHGGKGEAYIFENSGGVWTEATRLHDLIPAGDRANGDGFGLSMEIDGDLAVVGARDVGGSGAVYVFERIAGTWTYDGQKITASDADVGDDFGWDVTIDDGMIVVSALGNEAEGGVANGGTVYFFENQGGEWTEVDRVERVVPNSGDGFGGNIAYTDGHLLVGASREDSSQGAVFAYGDPDNGDDVLIGGAGDDTLIIGDAQFHYVDGGEDTDTLKVDFDFDITNLLGGILDGIEIIDIANGNANTLDLSVEAVTNITEGVNALTGTANTLIVGSDPGLDTVNIGGGWTPGGVVDLDRDGDTVDESYQTYSDGDAQLYVQVVL